jgi:endonuclease III
MAARAANQNNRIAVFSVMALRWRYRSKRFLARVLLDHRNPFELLVATVLAAQCADERVCVARKPRCPECGLASVCPKRGV